MRNTRWMLGGGVVPVLALAMLTGPAVAADKTAPEKVAYQPPTDNIRLGTDAKTAAQAIEPSQFVLTAPPRGSRAEEQSVYVPIADYLSKVTGKKFVYKFSDNWLSYSKEMTEGDYDLVFDGPHFNGWRMDKIGYTPLVKLPEPFVFVVVAKADDAKVRDLKELAGRSVCAHAAPNLGTLTLLSQFDNPSRQPYIIVTKGWENSFDGLVQGKCTATVLPLKNLTKYDNGSVKKTKILYQARPLPNQALSAGPRIPAALQEKIRQAMLSPEGRRAAAKLLDTYASKELVPATRQEYAGLGNLLKDNLYYQ